MVDNPIYESADHYQNLTRRLHPHTLLNTAQQPSIYSEVADEGRVAGGEQRQKCVSEAAGNVSVDGGEKFDDVILDQISINDGCTGSNNY